MKKVGFVYILTNKHHTVLYVGFTSEIINRIYQHKTHFYKNSFTARYNIEYLVYFELHESIIEGIAREKVVKKLNRQLKIDLINSLNPEWKYLWDQIA